MEDALNSRGVPHDISGQYRNPIFDRVAPATTIFETRKVQAATTRSILGSIELYAS